MQESEAKKIGRSKILKSTGGVFAILGLVFFLSETSGDFANGFLFFLSETLNIKSILAMALLFIFTYYFSSCAGDEIINKNRNYIIVSLKYVSLIALIVSMYVVLLVCISRDRYYITIKGLLLVYFLPIFLKTFVSFLVAWIWATYKMKLFQKL